MLLHPGLAGKGRRYDGSGVMIAVAAQVVDPDLRVGQGFPDHLLDLGGIHRHDFCPFSGLMLRRPYSAAASPHEPSAAPAPIWCHDPRTSTHPRSEEQTSELQP